MLANLVSSLSGGGRQGDKGHKKSERFKVTTEDDPLSGLSKVTLADPSPTVTMECLSIRLADEVRIVSAMVDAAKKKTSGSIFSVKIDISRVTSLSIGVKDLQDSMLVVSMVKRSNGFPGAVEQAGVRLGTFCVSKVEYPLTCFFQVT